MTQTKKVRTPEQKAAHAKKERERRAARKAVEQHADEIVAERDAADDFIDQAIAAHPSGHGAVVGEPGTVDPNQMEAQAAIRTYLSNLDSVTLYRKVKEEIAERKANPGIATPHLDELNARKGRKVIAGTTARTSKRAARHPLFDAAEKRRAELSNKRGKGIKVTPEELIPVAARLRAEGLTARQACEVAYWVENLSVARTRWAVAWAATETVEKGAAI
jgi:hypothetical protein